jgi:hypothetical protein
MAIHRAGAQRYSFSLFKISLGVQISALFIRLIIRTFQLVFSAGTMFFSHNKSANSVFQPTYQHSRTGPRFCANFICSSELVSQLLFG